MGESLTQLFRDFRKIYTGDLPRGLFWAVINHCNAVCTTCNFYLVRPEDKTHLTLQEAKAATEVLYNSGFRFTSITGGEPLMNPDFFDIIDAITAGGLMITYIPTNGTLVDRHAAQRLKDADVKVVGVSVELVQEDGMGSTRKIPGLREILVQSREALDSEGVPSYAGVLLSKATLDIPKVMEFVQDLGFDKVVFSYPQLQQESSYIASRAIPDIDLSSEQVERVVAEIKAAKHDFPELGIYNTEESLNDFVKFYRGEARRYGCWGGKKLFYLDWNLDLYQCFTLPKKYGNLLTLGRVEVEEEGLCDLCTQQAFRDFGPFYAGAQAAKTAADFMKTGHPIRAIESVTAPDALDGLRALREVHSAGFL